jgi:beta-lactamase regulating signal transducer with metallopeptidase domain
MITSLPWLFEHVMPALLRASWQATVLAGIVLLIHRLLGARLSARARHMLWAVVVLRLLMPIVPQSPLSVFNLARMSAGDWSSERSERATGASAAFVGKLSALENGAGAPAGDTAPLQIASGSVAKRVTVPMVLGITWACGVLVLCVRVARACISVSRLRRQLDPVDDPQVARIVEQSAKLLRLRGLPVVLAGDHAPTPAVVGMLRPALLLPARVLRDFDPQELKLIVLHELAHLKRHDIAGNWVLCIATMVHWFNPLVWLIAWRVRGDRELACDELVLLRSEGGEAQAYGRTLLKLIEHLSPRPAPRQLVGIVESSGPIKRRVRMIARFNPRSSGGWLLGLCLVVMLGCTTLTDAVSADDKKAPPGGAVPAAFAPAAQADPGGADAGAATEAELQAALQRVVPELRFEGVTFGDVVQFIRDICKVNIVVESKMLEAAGIDRSAPVTMNLRRITLEQALEHLLKDIGGGTVLLDYMIDKGAIVISTEEALAGRVKTVFYNVQHLMVGPDGKPLAGEQLAAKMKSLTKIIQDFVASDTWRDNGGSVGGIAEFNGKLIITHTPKHHQQIAWLLDKLGENPTTVPALAEK